MAYKNLTDAVDILCEVVFGIAGGVGHVGNIIQFGGEWYRVDTTWDAPPQTGRVMSAATTSGRATPT